MMTSSVAAASTALLFAPNEIKTAASDTPGTNSEESKTSAATIGPLTDILATHTSSNHAAVLHKHPSSSPITTTKTNSSSKIPHPQPHPLAVLLASKTNQFRRSASLRLRGSKSNLLFNTFSRGNNNRGRTNPHKSTCHRKEHVDTRAFNALATNGTMDEHQAAVTHELTTAGRVSPRRKLTLNSQQNTVGLTRSLSLRRNQNQHQVTNPINNTNFNKESCTLSATEKDLVAQDNKGDATKVHQEISTTTATSSTLDVGSVSASSTPNKQLEELRISSENVQGTQKQDNTKMSLNLNGPTTTATTTNVRPTTLATTTTPATGTNSATATTPSASSRAVTKTASSPKTPKTPIAKLLQSNHQQHSFSNQQHQQHHHHHSHQHCFRYQQQHQQALPSVPETKLTPRTPPVTPDSPETYLEDDLDSLYSFATTTSGRSTMSCEHPYVARNGTTFSGRKMKYVVHCSNYAGQVGPDYLTPTQRAQRQIRRLKDLLCVARQDLEQKDSEILRLTREVVELRLFKASLSSPEDRSASSDAVTVREAELKTSQDVSPIIDMVDDANKCSPRHIVHGSHHQQNALHSEMQSSFADSGHFEDMTSSSVHSKDSYAGHTHDIACGSDEPGAAGGAEDDEDEEDEARKADSYELQRQELIRMYEQRIEELIRTQDSATSEIKRSHNDKVEALLQKLAECNTRYADIVPDYEHAKERIRELEKQLEDLQRKLAEHEEKQNKMYLHMYQKGQEAERIARADQALELAHRAPSNKVSINELLHQLQSTQDELENIRAAECRKETGGNHALLTAKEAISLWVLGARKTIYRRLLDAQKNRTHVDPEVTLQFLKSAVYYFLTDKENSQGHLQAIESILEFTEAEKQNITKARAPK